MNVQRVDLQAMIQIFSMIQDTWDEVDQRKHMGMVLDPNWEAYKQLEEAGILYTYMFEDKGFASFIVSPDLHRQGKYTATSDVIYIQPEHRGCLEECLAVIEEELWINCVDYISVTVKSREQDELYGMKLYEKTYQRAL